MKFGVVSEKGKERLGDRGSEYNMTNIVRFALKSLYEEREHQ